MALDKWKGILVVLRMRKTRANDDEYQHIAIEHKSN